VCRSSEAFASASGAGCHSAQAPESVAWPAVAARQVETSVGFSSDIRGVHVQWAGQGVEQGMIRDLPGTPTPFAHGSCCDSSFVPRVDIKRVPAPGSGQGRASLHRLARLMSSSPTPAASESTLFDGACLCRFCDIAAMRSLCAGLWCIEGGRGLSRFTDFGTENGRCRCREVVCGRSGGTRTDGISRAPCGSRTATSGGGRDLINLVSWVLQGSCTCQDAPICLGSIAR